MPESPALALVTGAAHRVGREIAAALVRAGYTVGLHYHRSEQAAQQTAQELRELGGTVFTVQADLTDGAQIDRMFEQVDTWGCPLRVLVNSAAVMPAGDLRTLSEAEWDAALALNLRAPWLCARAAARRMSTGGVIINITDSGARKAWTGYPAYTISKAGLETLTRLLAKTLAPQVRVNAVAPGLILPSPEVSPEHWQKLVERLPLKRAGSPAAVAKAVLFLVENDYITGETLVVDGGYQLV